MADLNHTAGRTPQHYASGTSDGVRHYESSQSDGMDRLLGEAASFES